MRTQFRDVELADISAAEPSESSDAESSDLDMSWVRTQNEASAWIQHAINNLKPEVESAMGVPTYWDYGQNQVNPKIFRQLRRLRGVPETYLEDICRFNLERHAWEDDRPSWNAANFILQPLFPHEVLFFEKIADQYKDYLEVHPESLILRLVAIYKVDKVLHIPKKGTANITGVGCSHLAITTSFLPIRGKPLDYLYRLRGAKHKRYVLRTGQAEQILQDQNFIEEQQVAFVPQSTQERLCAALKADARFLEEIGAVQYCLLLGIHKQTEASSAPTNYRDRATKKDVSFQRANKGWRLNKEPVTYYLGIVHILRSWSFLTCLLTIPRNIRRDRVFTSAGYARRFLAFIEDRLVPVAEDGDVLCPEIERMNSATFLSSNCAQALTIAAAAELRDQSKGEPTVQELAEWQCLVDMFEAGFASVDAFKMMGLVQDGAEDALPAFSADVAKTQLPPFPTMSEQNRRPTGVAKDRIYKFIRSVDQFRAARTVGGGAVSESSRQYSLALAIAVGVETATRCSRVLKGRSARLFQKYPSLASRPAAVEARRTYFIPEEGSWLSPPQILPGLQFVEHAPEVFCAIREVCGIDDKAYIECVCQRDFSFIEFSANSKSGQFFFFTHDTRCMVKTISPGEAEALLRLLREGYREHLAAREGSLITRIFGLYQVQLRWFNSGKPQHFMVQENVFYSPCHRFTELFDLKGSTLGRASDPSDSVQKDNDWTNKGYSFGFKGLTRERIARQHQRDCKFLANCQVIDYSLLVGIAANKPKEDGDGRGESGEEKTLMTCRARMPRMTMVLPTKPGSKELWNLLREEFVSKGVGAHGPFEAHDSQVFFVGIIDFLITWDWWKKAEFALRRAQCKSKEASVNPPMQYAQRQVDFFQSIL